MLIYRVSPMQGTAILTGSGSSDWMMKQVKEAVICASGERKLCCSISLQNAGWKPQWGQCTAANISCAEQLTGSTTMLCCPGKECWSETATAIILWAMLYMRGPGSWELVLGIGVSLAGRGEWLWPSADSWPSREDHWLLLLGLSLIRSTHTKDSEFHHALTSSPKAYLQFSCFTSPYASCICWTSG